MSNSTTIRNGFADMQLCTHMTLDARNCSKVFISFLRQMMDSFKPFLIWSRVNGCRTLRIRTAVEHLCAHMTNSTHNLLKARKKIFGDSIYTKNTCQKLLPTLCSRLTFCSLPDPCRRSVRKGSGKSCPHSPGAERVSSPVSLTILLFSCQNIGSVTVTALECDEWVLLCCSAPSFAGNVLLCVQDSFGKVECERR